MFRVAGIYAAVAWLLTEISSTVFPLLQLPAWSVTLVVALLVLGFPVALVLAWAYDVGPAGMERTPAPDSGRTGWLGYGVLLLVSTAALSALLYYRHAPAPPTDDVAELSVGPPRVAVLPFADLSPDGDQVYFSDGFHDELISQLSSISGLAVSSRTSVMPYRTVDRPLREIAAELRASAIVEGTVRYMDERVRVTAQLIDASTDDHLWSGQYDRERSTEDIFAIQEEVATEIAQALQIEVSADDRTHLARIPTRSLEAYDAYSLGRYHLWRWNRNDLRKATDFLQQAVAFDPDFADAHAELGWAYAVSATSYGGMPPAEMVPKARASALRATGLDPGLRNARELLLDLRVWYDWQWDGIDDEYRRLIADYPKKAGPRISYAFTLSALGRHEEAVRMIEEAMELYPGAISIKSNAGWRYLYAGRIQESLTVARRALALDASFDEAWNIVGHCQIALGKLDEALESFLVSGNSVMEVFVLGRLGREDEARARIERQIDLIKAGEYVPPFDIATQTLGLRDFDATFEWLGRAVTARNRHLILLNSDPMWEPIRDDPRYAPLIRQVGLQLPDT